jgi:hypothetical protein
MLVPINPSLHMVHHLPSSRTRVFLVIFEVFWVPFLLFGIIEVVVCRFLLIHHCMWPTIFLVPEIEDF